MFPKSIVGGRLLGLAGLPLTAKPELEGIGFREMNRACGTFKMGTNETKGVDDWLDIVLPFRE